MNIDFGFETECRDRLEDDWHKAFQAFQKVSPQKSKHCVGSESVNLATVGLVMVCVNVGNRLGST